MKKGEIYTGTIERLEFPDKGILFLEGEKVVIKHTLPGQNVEFMVTKKRKGKCEGRLISILSKAEYEREQPECRHSGLCGGCSYQTVPYEKQLELKEKMVRGILDGAIEGDYCFEGIKGSPLIFEYRNKMEYSFGDEVKDGPLALGMHKRGSFYDIVTVDGCRLVHPDYGKILDATLTYFKEMGGHFYKKLAHVGYLRHLLVRRGVQTGEILVDLVTTGQTEGGWEAPVSEDEFLSGWKKRLLDLSVEGRFVGILHTRNDSLADVVQDGGTEILFGQGWFYEELLGLKFKITPFSFFQTNSLGAEVLYRQVREYIGDVKGSKVFDLYSGTGTIAQILAPVAEHVTGVEIVEEAVAAARENAALNGLSNCEFIAGDVLKVLDTLTEQPDFIILDPPREGIHPKALPKILAYGVQRIVYVSCKPTSLVRDLPVFQAGGYKVEKVCCVDQFANTGHVETVVLLTQKRKSKDYKVEIEIPIGVDGSKTYTEEKSTYQNIKKFIKAKYGVNTHTKDIAEVKRDCGVEMRLNYNISKKENPKIRHCTQEKRGYIMDALEHYQVI